MFYTSLQELIDETRKRGKQNYSRDPILLQGKGQSIVKNEIIEKALRHWPIVLENMLE